SCACRSTTTSRSSRSTGWSTPSTARCSPRERRPGADHVRPGRTASSAAAAAPIAAAPEWSTAEPPVLDPHRFTYSVVIPVFNSEPIVATTIDRTVAFFESHGFSYEVILVNDGSTDGSWDVLQRAPARYPHVRVINLLRNYGQH